MTEHAVIFYESDGYVATGKELMGRQAAGAGFLRAAAQSDATRLICHANHLGSSRDFSRQLAQYGFSGNTDWIPTLKPELLAQEGCLYVPGPGLGDFSWRRSAVGASAYSVCGVTHTTASHNAMSAITQILTAPVESWDALICTSSVVRDTAHILLERQMEYLREYVGATRFTVPQLPIIPLGVHCDDYVFSEGERIQARQSMGVEADEVVVLFVGRLSFHAKAHPLQMYTALEKSAKGRKIHLVQCGWFANESIKNAFIEGAQVLCASIKTSYVAGTDAPARRKAWASADVFISLSDNIQETFGLTPVEAMASGLPVIVSDWNGYKDTVRDQIDGFRIPTLAPDTPLGEEFAQRYEVGEMSYDAYCGYTSQFIALDPVALEAACTELFRDVNKRRSMGTSGRIRARSEFDWSVIYSRYQALWAELAIHRAIGAKRALPALPVKRPDRLDPFLIFANYPTTRLNEQHRVTLLSEKDEILNVRQKLLMNSFAASSQLNEEESKAVIQILKKGECTVQKITEMFPLHRQNFVMRGLVWLAKMEVIHIHFL